MYKHCFSRETRLLKKPRDASPPLVLALGAWSVRMFTFQRTTIKTAFAVLSALCTFYMHWADIQQFKQCRHHLHASALSIHASALLYTHLHFSTRHKKDVMPFASTTPFYGHGRQSCLLREAEFSVAPTQKSPSLYNRKQMLSPHLRHSPDKQCITCQWQLHAAKLKMVQCRQ